MKRLLSIDKGIKAALSIERGGFGVAPDELFADKDLRHGHEAGTLLEFAVFIGLVVEEDFFEIHAFVLEELFRADAVGTIAFGVDFNLSHGLER